MPPIDVILFTFAVISTLLYIGRLFGIAKANLPLPDKVGIFFFSLTIFFWTSFYICIR